jgi:hypothetical protein
MHHDIPGADEARPRNLRVRRPKSVIQPPSRLADNRDLPAHSIHYERVRTPIRTAQLDVVGDMLAGIPNVHDVNEWIPRGHRRF